MDIHVNDNYWLDPRGQYVLKTTSEAVVNSITKKTPTLWYALLDGKLYKDPDKSGVKGIFFKSKELLITSISESLYGTTIIPHIGCSCGYYTDEFMKELQKEVNVEFKNVEF